MIFSDFVPFSLVDTYNNIWDEHVGFSPLEALITLQQSVLDRTQESRFLRVHPRENFKSQRAGDVFKMADDTLMEYICSSVCLLFLQEPCLRANGDVGSEFGSARSDELLFTQSIAPGRAKCYVCKLPSRTSHRLTADFPHA
jgi:hypothetical protein